MDIPFLDERQNKDVKFCLEYTDKFAHGADGHNRMITVALMARHIMGDDEPVSTEPLALHGVSDDGVALIRRAVHAVRDEGGDVDLFYETLHRLYMTLVTIDRHVPYAVRRLLDAEANNE